MLLELRPAAILQTGLEDLLQRLARALRTHLEQPIQVEIEGSGQLPGEVHIAFYRLAQAALAMSSATRRRRRRGCGWSSADASATLVISDDGGGFDPDALGERQGMGFDDHARAGRGNRRRSEDRQRHRPRDDRDAALARLISRSYERRRGGPRPSVARGA